MQVRIPEVFVPRPPVHSVPCPVLLWFLVPLCPFPLVSLFPASPICAAKSNVEISLQRTPCSRLLKPESLLAQTRGKGYSSNGLKTPNSFVAASSIPHTNANRLYLHISTAKSNGKISLQRNPLCNPMKVGFLPPETVEGELISFWTGGLAISAIVCITYS